MYEYKTIHLNSIDIYDSNLSSVDWYFNESDKDRFVKAYSSIDGKLVAQSNRFSDAVFAYEQTYAERAIGHVS